MIVSFAREGQVTGQHPEEAIPQLLATGHLLPTDHYWQEGMAEWGLVGERWSAPEAKATGQPRPLTPKGPTQAQPITPALRVQQKAAGASSSRTRWMLIAAAVAVVVLAAGAYFYVSKPASSGQSATKTTGSHEKISVISWNLEWYPGRKPNASPEQQAKHKDAAKAELRKLDPDIFMGQEIATWDDFIDLCSALPALNVAGVSNFMQGREVARQQTAIASKLPVFSAWYDNWKPATPQPPRGYTMAAVSVPGTDKLLLFYSLHLKSNRSDDAADEQKNFQQRDESVRQLLAHIKVMEDETFKGRVAGVIVGGDFNTNHDGQFGDNVIKMMTDAGFVNTWADVPPEKRRTWRGGGKFKPTTFDYLLTKGLGSPKAEVLDAPEATSDHRPVRIEIPLPK